MRFSAGVLLFMLFVGLMLTACTGTSEDAAEAASNPRDVPEGDAAQGRELIANYGCGACHTIAGVPGADSQVGPPLTNFHQRAYIAGTLANNWQNLVTWIQLPQSVEPGTAMPNLGVSESEARDMAAYLYNQPAASLFSFNSGSP